MRVGRSALDEDAIRLLEQYNPDVEFDWTRILKGQPDAEAEVQPQGRAAASRRDPMPRSLESSTVEAPARGSYEQDMAAPQPPPQPTVPATAFVEEADIEAEQDREPERDLPPSAALARLGPEGLLRLRARHAEVMARIADRVTDSARQEELKSKAERLNPDTWVTDEEVTAGLDAYEPTFEQIRAAVGRPRRRRRRHREPSHGFLPAEGDLGRAQGPEDSGSHARQGAPAAFESGAESSTNEAEPSGPADEAES